MMWEAKMPSLPKEVATFMEKYGVDSDEVWLAPGGKTWVIKHKALERVAANQKIKFDRPSVIACDLERRSMVICTFATLGDITEWSFGEASPENCKNAYMAAMAEKRSRDRVILKLLATSGELYSETEADEFTQPRQNPHVTRPSDIAPAVQYDEHGQPIDNIPLPDPSAVQKLRVVDQRPIFAEMQKAIHATGSVNELRSWAIANKDRTGSLKADWQEILRGVYAEHLAALRTQEQGDETRMAS
jgi:hypothetical protein